MFSSITRLGITFISAAALAACSGGGGGGGNGNGGRPQPMRAAQTIVYSAGDGVSTNGMTELYSIGDDSSGRTMLSVATAFDNTSIQDFKVSPDGQWVAYISNARTTTDYDLYVTPINGGLQTRVSRSRVLVSGRVAEFDWSADSSMLTYSGNLGGGSLANSNAKEIFLVNRDGSGEKKINGGIGDPAIVEVRNPRFSPDGRYILQEVARFSGGTASSQAFALNVYDTTISTFNSRRVAEGVSVLRNVYWSPSSERFSFTADIAGSNSYHVYSAETLGTRLTRVTDNGSFNSDSRWSPDGTTLAYLDHPNAPFPADLVVSGATAGAPDTVLAFVTPNNKQVRDYVWSPAGDRIAYTADHDTAGVFELYVINSDGSGNRTKVSGPMIDTGDVFKFAWSPDGNSIAYLADQDTNTFIDLYVSNATGGNNTWISMGLNGEEVTDFAWSDDNQRIAFSTGPEGRNPQANKLYVSQPNGNGRSEITPAMTVGPLRFEYD